jgi:cbb3-type cytochrome oxidase subunit 3
MRLFVDIGGIVDYPCTNFSFHNDMVFIIIIIIIIIIFIIIIIIIYINIIYRTKEDGAFDSQSASTIKLNNGTILYLREVNRYLALVCILREDSFDKQGMLLKFYCIP